MCTCYRCWYELTCGFLLCQDVNGECWNAMCPRCATFDVDSFDPNADFCARLPVAPIFSDYVTNLIVNEEISRKRKHKAFVTSQETNEALDGTRDSLVSDDGTITDDEAYEKQQNGSRAADNEHGKSSSKKSLQKAKKTSSGAQDKGGNKKSEKAPKKKPESAASTQKKSKPVAKKPKTDKAPGKSSQSSVDSAEAGSSQQSSSSTFRPQYESVFSR